MPTTAALPTVAEVRSTAFRQARAEAGGRGLHAMLLAIKSGGTWQEEFAARWPAERARDPVSKAAIEAITTGSAGGLVPETFVTEWALSLRPATVLGKLTGAVPAPFHARLVSAVGGAVAYWVGEGKVKPMTKVDYMASSALPRRKVVALAVVTEDVLMAPGVDAEGLVQAELAGALVQETDLAFLDPANAGSEDKPASITNVCISVPSSGSDAAAIEADLASALGQLIGASSRTPALCVITSSAIALHLSTLRDPSGARTFPGVTLTGGELAGAPLIVSASAGDQIVVLDESLLLVARDALAMRPPARQATVNMADTTTGEVRTRSLFQLDCVGLLLEQTINWQARPGAVARVADIVLPALRRAA